jgi:hypothetical protein
MKARSGKKWLDSWEMSTYKSTDRSTGLAMQKRPNLRVTTMQLGS